MRTASILFFALFLVASLATGCTNTMDGMGQDIEHAGQTIQNTF